MDAPEEPRIQYMEKEKMMLITASVLSEIAGKKINDNMLSAVAGLKIGGKVVGLYRPHRLAHFFAQTGHESGGWYWDREIWGPTKAQLGYEGRKDLGNIYPGDGSLFRGYTPMQITGRYNTTKFYKWCVKTFPELNVPDFTKKPHLMNSDPYEGLGPIWYWSEGKPVSLNESADASDFIRNTKLVNGGTNGLADRYKYYGRAGLVLLGYSATDLKSYQAKRGLGSDGVMGPKTYAAMNADLLALPDVRFTEEKETSSSALALLKQIYELIGNYLKTQN